jgi:hypothetical protein
MYESGKTTTLWNYLLLAGQRRTSGTLYKGALRMWLRLSVCNRQGLAVLVLSLALIHRSAWNRNSRKLPFTIRRRNRTYGGHALVVIAPPARFKPHMATIVARNRYELLRLATARRCEKFRQEALIHPIVRVGHRGFSVLPTVPFGRLHPLPSAMSFRYNGRRRSGGGRGKRR